MKPIVQISLDITTSQEALETAEMAMRAGVDWLEAGTPLIIAEGMHGVRALRERFPDTPIVADLKTMDGGYLEAEMMAKAGATHVVVMARAHEETIRCVVKAGHDFGVEVMGDNMVCDDMVAGARWLEDLGCDFVIHHIGYDERRGIAARGQRMPSPLDQLRERGRGRQRAGAGRRRADARTGRAHARVRRAAGRARRAADDRRRRVQDRQRRPGKLAALDLREGSRLRRRAGGKEGLRPEARNNDYTVLPLLSNWRSRGNTDSYLTPAASSPWPNSPCV